MGAGRSGSTIFGVVLGNCAKVFYAGELDAWLVRSGVPQLGGAERVRFWTGVREEVSCAAELFGDEAQRCLERSVAALRVSTGGPYGGAYRKRYLRVAEDLYRAIGQATGATHIVDTSHYPLRAWELQRLRGVELYLIYLVRDAQSVVASFKRQDVAQYSKSPLTTNIYLWLTNLLAVFVFHRQPPNRRLLVRYEDLIARPEELLSQILTHIECRCPSADLGSLSTGLAFQGNRVIRSDFVRFDRSATSRARAWSMTALLQLPWVPVLRSLQPAARPSASGSSRSSTA